MSREKTRVLARRAYTAGFIAAGFVTLAACHSVFSPKTEFTVRVDSVSAPASIGPADTLVARFFGMVGSDRCSRITHVEREADSSGLVIQFHGERIERNCGQMPVFLEHEERITPPLNDPYTIRVVQPAGPPLEVLVRVE